MTRINAGPTCPGPAASCPKVKDQQKHAHAQERFRLELGEETKPYSFSMDLRLHTSFFDAVRSGDAAAVCRVVDGAGRGEAAAALMREKTEAGETALYITAEWNYEEVFRYLVGFCDLETAKIRSGKDMDAIMVAAKEGHVGIVKELLALWPELCRQCDSSNMTPLYCAAVRNHLDVVNAILDVDESSMMMVRKNGKTSLHMAARIGHHRIVKALIDKDPAIVSIIDKKGQTALHMAVKGKNTEVVEELVNADPSILNIHDKKGNTALHIATRKWRPQMVHLLLSYSAVEVNAVNSQDQTALDLAEKVPYEQSQMDILETVREAGGKNARYVGKLDEESILRRTVSDIKHGVHDQLIQNAKTNKRVTGIAKELKKLHREAVKNTINSVTVVAVLIASIAFVAIFNLPGQYVQNVPDSGKANIAETTGFRVFCLLNAIALFISLAVVVVQITLVAWETGAQKQVVAVVNKLMWVASLSTCGAFLALAFVVVGKDASWMAITITAIGGPVMIGTLVLLGYWILKQKFKFGEDSQRRIKRGSGSKSFSWSHYSAYSDSDHEKKKFYAL